MAQGSYPSPNAGPNTSGPFYGDSTNNTVPSDLQQLQQVEVQRPPPAPMMSSPQSNTMAYSHVGQPIDPQTQDANSPERLAQGAQGMLGIGEQTPFGDPGDAGDPAKKRSKISRACDECRRKKIKCDATEHSTCSGCRRNHAECSWSRQPQKRGPSKGYIKDLSDRLNMLETQIGPQPSAAHWSELQQLRQLVNESGLMRTDMIQDYNPTHNGSRKRTHSMSEGGQRDIPYTPGAPWPPQFHPYSTPQSAPMASSAHMTDYSAVEPSKPDSVGPIPQQEADISSLYQWDEDVVTEYYRLIHRTFPLLPGSKPRLRSLLASCSPTLREAFFVALENTIRTSPSTTLAPLTDSLQATRKASELISASQFEANSTPSMASNFIYIQCLILMALESDNHGPATMRGHRGPARREWLGRAIGQATELKLNSEGPRSAFLDGDIDSDEKLGRRLWWILFILDRWHASSTSSTMLVSESSAQLVLEDQIILGESTYHLARLSFILGHLAELYQHPATLVSETPIIPVFIRGEIERFRESVESMLHGAPNLLHLSYAHVKLLILRLTPKTTQQELLEPALRMASILNQPNTVVTPLNHHFAALSALTLGELTEYEETRAGAEKGIEEIYQALSSRKGLMSREDSTGWDSAIRDLIIRKKGQINEREDIDKDVDKDAGTALQHLADAAIGGNRSKAIVAAASKSPGRSKLANATDGGYDPTMLPRSGYLDALVQHEAK